LYPKVWMSPITSTRRIMMTEAMATLGVTDPPFSTHS
jgi:hypothetical protein